MKKQNGFSIGLVIVVIAVVALAGVLVWRVMTLQQPNVSPPTTSSTDSSINSTEDLQDASQSLDDASLDTNLDASSFDDDVNSVL